MNGTSERHNLEIIRYRTPAGQPTCAIDFVTGDVCPFFQTYKLGQAESYSTSSVRKLRKPRIVALKSWQRWFARNKSEMK